MAGKSPTQRTLEYLRKEGWPLVQVVEYYHAPSRKRRDLFGFCDILAFHPERGHLYVQTTTGNNAAARVKKIKEDASGPARILLGGDVTIEVHGWRKLKRKGNRWHPRITKITASMLLEENNE